MKNKKLVSKVIDNILNVLIVLFAIFLLISIYTLIQVKVLKNEYSNFFGYSLFEVQTGSMHGTIEVGDWIIVKTGKDVKVGDIITYKQSNDFITHRVVESFGGTYVTKGDANNHSDDPIDQSQIVGKVVKTLRAFGILKKTIFNPVVIILLIITLYLFNLTFKTTKSTLDIKIEETFTRIKNKIMKSNDKPVVKKIELPKLEKKEEPVVLKEIESKEEMVEEPIVEEIKEEKVDEEKKEEELSKTSMFRVISIKREEPKKEEVKEEKKEEELSKTSMFRFISVNNKKDEAPIIKEKEMVPVQEKESKPVIKLYAEEVEKKEKPKIINQDYIYGLIKSKKSKNIIDKTFFVKKIVYDEILDVILRPCKAYIYKSNIRTDFINQYMAYKYYGTESDRKIIKKLIKNFSGDLIGKNIRDENKVNTINAYTDAFIFISNIEDKKNCNYKAELKTIFDYEDEVLTNMANDISNIIKYSNEYLLDVLNKLDTNTFEVKYNKFVDQKSLYGVILNHNIAFSKVYSDYIVDKTYSEGIVSEDKLEVLLNMLLCRVVFDIMRSDYSPKYFVYIPKALYGKDKKLDKIASIIDNDYAKTHIYFLTSVSNMLKNKDDLRRLRKRGYSFACVFDKRIEYKHDDMGYIYMNDYFFVDSYSDAGNVCKGVPKEITDKIIIDSISKKVGDYGGE